MFVKMHVSVFLFDIDNAPLDFPISHAPCQKSGHMLDTHLIS